MVSAAPAVTVGLPVFNSEKFLTETLRSILNQTFTDFEVVISDNASTDGTGALCEEFAREDPRIRYYRQSRNIGLPRNYNSLVTLARGRHFKWASSNDIIQPPFLQACVPILESRADVVLAYPRTRFFSEASPKIHDHADNLDLQQSDPVERYKACDQGLFYNNIINGLIRLETLKSTTLHRDYPSSDLALMPELALYGKFIEVPQPLFYRRMGATAFYGAGTAEAHPHYYPDDRFGSSRRGWQRLRHMMAGVTRAPITWKDRIALYDYLARRSWWRRGELLPLFGRRSKHRAGAAAGTH